MAKDRGSSPEKIERVLRRAVCIQVRFLPKFLQMENGGKILPGIQQNGQIITSRELDEKPDDIALDCRMKFLIRYFIQPA